MLTPQSTLTIVKMLFCIVVLPEHHMPVDSQMRLFYMFRCPVYSALWSNMFHLEKLSTNYHGELTKPKLYSTHPAQLFSIHITL